VKIARTPREPNFREPGSARRPRGPGSTRSPSRACEWPCLKGCAGADPGPGDKSDRLRGVGQALDLLAHARVGVRTRVRTAGRPRAHPARPKADKIYRRAGARCAWHPSRPGTRGYISRDDGCKSSTQTASYSTWSRKVGAKWRIWAADRVRGGRGRTSHLLSLGDEVSSYLDHDHTAAERLGQLGHDDGAGSDPARRWRWPVGLGTVKVSPSIGTAVTSRPPQAAVRGPGQLASCLNPAVSRGGGRRFDRPP